MEDNHRMIIEGGEYDCLLNEESAPYNCVRIQDPQAESEQPASASAVATASAMAVLAIILFIVCYKKICEKK